MSYCPICNQPIKGRIDKKFCSSTCRSNYHNALRDKQSLLYYKIDKQLKLNRTILRKYNLGGKSILRKSILTELGFNPNYTTHKWRSSKGQTYYFCYEYGFLPIREKDIEKYVLIHWQEYMDNKR